MLTAANSRDFKPIPLGIHIRANIPTEIRQIESSNVIAKVEGSDPQLKSQAVIFTAHWDHLGIGPAVNGDSIYNGAVDNATGCAHDHRDGARLGRAGAQAEALGDFHGGDGGRSRAARDRVLRRASA